ncbi:hypothetical protein KBA41_02625 [Candidatus Ozemobacteraceae bacterium]|nr:hypothetical protein [Candidatus Ozemobacteraceae bacterium]
MKRVSDARLTFALAIYQAVFGLALMGAATAAPFLAGRTRRVREGLQEYFGGLPCPPAGPLVWVHGVSMGESAVAGALMDNLKKRASHLRLGFTTTHPDVLATERRRKRADVTGYFPLDTWPGMARAFDRWNPVMAIVSETDFWPVFSRTCRARGIPLVLANGRISDKLHRFYAAFPAFGRAVFEPFTLLAVQSETDARRLREMGACPGRIRVTGNVKADLAAVPSVDAARLTREWTGSDRLVVFGSIHPAEFELLVPVWKRLLEGQTGCRILAAPRNPALAADWERRLASAGIPSVRRSAFAAPSVSGADPRLMLLDTMGELAALYGLAAVAFVGGTLDPAVGGHNPLEVLNHGVPLVMGPHARNFADLVDELVAAGGMERQADVREIQRCIEGILHAPPRAAELRTAAEAVLVRHRGALGRTLELLAPLLPPGSRRTG